MPARMPKFLWIILVVLFPTIGPIAWIIVSRVKAAEERGGFVEPTVWSSKEGTTFRRPERARPMAPDDDPEFLRDLEQDIRRRKHHPEKPADSDDKSAGGGNKAGGDPQQDDGESDAGEAGDSDRSGTEQR